MNCHEFLNRMHDCIDNRTALEDEPVLLRHIGDCPSCRGQWNAWRQIAAILPDEADKPLPSARSEARGNRLRFRSVGLGLAIAVVVLAMFVSKPADDRADNVGKSSIATANTVDGPADDFIDDDPLDAALWWEDVRRRDWVAQTMPTVRSVRDGVAPLGRSILQAVSILTVGGGERTS